MTVSAATLREIHRIHRQISDLRGRLERGPRQVKASQVDLEKMQQAFAADKETLQRTRVVADEKQLQLREREARIKDLRAKLNGCSSNREYQTLRDQIAADQQANSVLSDEILEALERIDQQQGAVAEQEQACEKAVADLATLQQHVEEEHTSLASELERVSADLQQAEDALPATIKMDYQRIARARGEEALAEVDSETCTGCYHTLSPQTINLLMLGRARFCSSCGALLYLPEDTSPTA